MKKIILGILVMSSVLCARVVRNFTISDKDSIFAITSSFNNKLEERFNAYVLSRESPNTFIYLDSPGGSVLALASMVETMKLSKSKFICIAKFAASAAFMLFQHCDERYMLDDSIIMSHNASITLSGEVPRLIGLLKALEGITTKLDKTVSKRLGLTLKEYRDIIANELWLNIEQAFARKAVDRKATIKCSKELIEGRVKKKTKQCSIFGCTEKEETFSACPLFLNPVN